MPPEFGGRSWGHAAHEQSSGDVCFEAILLSVSDHASVSPSYDYARIVKRWIQLMGADPQEYGTHSLRRTKATLIYRRPAALGASQDRKHRALLGSGGREALAGHRPIEAILRRGEPQRLEPLQVAILKGERYPGAAGRGQVHRSPPHRRRGDPAPPLLPGCLSHETAACDPDRLAARGIWHVDRTGIRLLCTWFGPGNEWLDDPRIDPRGLPGSAAGAPATGQARPFDILLLKGSAWQGNAAGGAIHRCW